MVICVTSETIPGRQIVSTLGLVAGSTIRARHIGKDIMAIFRTLVGGEIQEYTKMMAEAREEALQRLIQKANEMGADAIISLRFSTAMILASTAEILAYGTAVKLAPETEEQ